MEETKIGMNYSMEGIGGVREKAPDNSSTPAPPGTETAALDYPSMEGKGFEEVTVPRPPLFRGHLGMFYESHDPGFENLALRDTVPYVTKSINGPSRKKLWHPAALRRSRNRRTRSGFDSGKRLLKRQRQSRPLKGAALLNRVNLFLGGLHDDQRETTKEGENNAEFLRAFGYGVSDRTAPLREKQTS